MKRLILGAVVSGFLFCGLLGVHSSAAGPEPDPESGSPARPVTFTRDVAPIIFENCASCHRPGDVAPMSLLSYKEVRPWARSIKEKTLSHEMPPWPADPHFGVFENDRRLSQKDIDTLVAWVDQGAREGDPKDLPPTPQFADEWHIGKPDVVLTMPKEHTIDADGPDDYQYIKIPTNFTQDMWVQAAEARPGNRKVVHHILAFVMPPESKGKNIFSPTPEMIEKLKEKVVFFEDGSLTRVKPDAPVFDDGCSTPQGGAGIFKDGTVREDDFGALLCGTAPGRPADTFPAGTAKKIPAGATILLQIHYSRDGKVEKDRSSIGLVFAKQPPDKKVNTEGVLNYHFQIPAGASNHEVTSCFTLPDDAHIISLMPHMHLRGKDMTIKAYYPDGRIETLLSVPHYSFSWQVVYYYKQPLAVPKGTRIECISHFDNSAGNKFNPNPAKTVRFGDPTYDEMMIGFMDYTLDGQHLVTDARAAK